MQSKPEATHLPRVAISHLTDTGGILAELRSLYRAARRGEIPTQDATRLGYLLKVMSEIMTLRELEGRLDALEDGRPYTPPPGKGKPRDRQESSAAH